MSMGSQGDHPLTDLLKWGINRYPTDIAEMLRHLNQADPLIWTRLQPEEELYLLCEVGASESQLNKSRDLLYLLLEKKGIDTSHYRAVVAGKNKPLSNKNVWWRF